jgi:hypothetical protein
MSRSDFFDVLACGQPRQLEVRERLLPQEPDPPAGQGGFRVGAALRWSGAEGATAQMRPAGAPRQPRQTAARTTAPRPKTAGGPKPTAAGEGPSIAPPLSGLVRCPRRRPALVGSTPLLLTPMLTPIQITAQSLPANCVINDCFNCIISDTQAASGGFWGAPVAAGHVARRQVLTPSRERQEAGKE